MLELWGVAVGWIQVIVSIMIASIACLYSWSNSTWKGAAVFQNISIIAILLLLACSCAAVTSERPAEPQTASVQLSEETITPPADIDASVATAGNDERDSADCGSKLTETTDQEKGRDAVTAQELSGTWWHREELSVDVEVRSWGKPCGPKLKPWSASRNPSIRIDLSQGSEDVASKKGNFDTSRCGTPSRGMKTVEVSATPGEWRRVCEKPPEDPHQERVETILTVDKNDILTHIRTSDLSWKKNGVLCDVTTVERMVFTRRDSHPHVD